jgi:hypothetical protein
MMMSGARSGALPYAAAVVHPPRRVERKARGAKRAAFRR